MRTQPRRRGDGTRLALILAALLAATCLSGSGPASPPAEAQVTAPAPVSPPPGPDQLALWASYPSYPDELRGVWATPDIPDGWGPAMANLAAANLNAVFPYVATAGAAWYPSQWVPDIAGRDLLAEACEACQASGVALHPRMLGLYTMCAPADMRDKLKAANRLMLDPQGKSTGWLCPLNPANRALVVGVATEIMSRYPVAGFQFDYLRYPGERYCYCYRCRSAFRKATGLPLKDFAAEVSKGALHERWLDWRREVLTSLMREVSAAVRQTRPDASFSAAVFLNWADHRDAFGQDWKAWVDQGLVDFVCPMNYTPSNDRFTLYVQRQIGWVGGRVGLCPGIGLNADHMTFPGPQALLDQITLSRNMGTQGWVIFNYCPELVREYLPVLKLGATRDPAVFDPKAVTLAP